jgi:plastocyanin
MPLSLRAALMLLVLWLCAPAQACSSCGAAGGSCPLDITGICSHSAAHSESSNPVLNVLPPPEEGVVDVAMVDSQFIPEVITITPGTTVRWTNFDLDEHDTVEPGSYWMSQHLVQGTSYSFEFPQESLGDYHYICTLHGGMFGTVTVVVPEPATAVVILCCTMIGSRPFRRR